MFKDLVLRGPDVGHDEVDVDLQETAVDVVVGVSIVIDSHRRM